MKSTNAKTCDKKNNFIQPKIFFYTVISLIVSGLMCLNGCQEEDSLEISTKTLDFQFTGENKSFLIESNIGWTVNSDAAWLTISPNSGSNNGNVTVTTAANDLTTKRTATITISGGSIIRTINVTQGEFIASLNVSTTSLTFPSSGGQNSFNIASNVSWTIEKSTATWLTISPTFGSKDSTITVTTTANDSSSDRTATITITAGGTMQTINVTQEGCDCSLEVSTTSLNFTSSGGQSTFRITSNTSWTIEKGSAEWFKISATSGSNDSTITVIANAIYNTRDWSATITVNACGKTQKINVTITGLTEYLTVSETSLYLLCSHSRSQTFNITTNSSWEVEVDKSNISWLEVSPKRGSGDREITVSATTNNSISDRKATVTVSGVNIKHSIEVTQEKFTPLLTVSDSLFSFLTPDEQEQRFSVISNIKWEVSSSATWLKIISSASNNWNGIITVRAQTNTTKLSREATLTIKGGDFIRTIRVTQPLGDDILNVSKSSLSFSGSGDSEKFSVSSNLKWTVSSNATWLKLSPSSGSNNEDVTVTADYNNTTSDRTATITIIGGSITRTINITQYSSVDIGSIVFWTSEDFNCGTIRVTLTGHGTKSITGYYYVGNPGCGSQHTATFTDLPIGIYSYTASCSGRTWSGTVTRTHECHKINLSYH